MISVRKLAPSLASVFFLMSSGAYAAPVTFGISSASISAGSGYGVDAGNNGENGGKLLDVTFTNTFAAQSFSLDVGDSSTFALGTVWFNEPDTGSGGNKGIRADEQDNLGVTATFTFTDPLGLSAMLSATGTATPGPISDTPEAVDYMLSWDPLDTDFGLGGKFRISLNTLSFSNVGTQTALATVELLSAPRVSLSSSIAVPEPGTLALVAVALAGLGASLRKRRT